MQFIGSELQDRMNVLGINVSALSEITFMDEDTIRDIIENRLVSRCSKHKNRSRHIILNPINPWGKHMRGLAGSTSDFPEQESGIRKFHQDLNHRKVVLVKNIGFNFALLHIQCLERLVLVQLPLSTAFSHAPEYPENL